MTVNYGRNEFYNTGPCFEKYGVIVVDIFFMTKSQTRDETKSQSSWTEKPRHPFVPDPDLDPGVGFTKKRWRRIFKTLCYELSF